MLSLGIKPMILALLAPCSTIWATGKPLYLNNIFPGKFRDIPALYSKFHFLWLDPAILSVFSPSWKSRALPTQWGRSNRVWSLWPGGPRDVFSQNWWALGRGVWRSRAFVCLFVCCVSLQWPSDPLGFVFLSFCPKIPASWSNNVVLSPVPLILWASAGVDEYCWKVKPLEWRGNSMLELF